MEIKLLCYRYDDNSGFKIVRAYLPDDFDQAERDIDLLAKHGSDSKTWEIKTVELFKRKP